MEKLRLGISACLLGMPVRYDGGHKLDHYLRDTLGRHVDFVPVCPEVECGFEVPRETMRLVGDAESPKLMTTRTKVDLTGRMAAWASKRVRELAAEDLCGFIFKSGSPSSGMRRVKVYGEKGGGVKNGTGLFARTFMDHFQDVPVEDEGRLHDPVWRENFIARVFTFHRWSRLIRRETPRMGAVLMFHAQNKLLFLSHSPRHYREMGRLVAEGKNMAGRELIRRYGSLLAAAMKMKATPRKNVQVLLHMMGRLKKALSPWEKGVLLEVIGQYRENQLPLLVPLTLLKHYVRKYDEPSLREQTYLEPHPLELRLRNYV